MTTEEKENSPKIKSKETFRKQNTIIETTYEKVLSIINKVKDFIKNTSTVSNTLIEDLEWVIKVITNKSLYTYELKQEKLVKLSKQNAEYNKFINFVTKYNEEVLEMNKKHDIVSGILSIGKKVDLLNKPSLCLDKILPDELKNMDDLDIKERKLRKKNNFINVFGNTILRLYSIEMEKRKTSTESDRRSGTTDNFNHNSIDNREENKSISISENRNIKNNNNEVENNIHTFNNSKIARKETDFNIENNNKLEKGKNKQKSDTMLEKDLRNEVGNMTKYNTDENFNDDIFNKQRLKTNKLAIDKNNINVNIQRIRIAREKDKLFDSKLKFKNSNFSKRKNNLKSVTKLSKNEKIIFNKIKNAMRNYYIIFGINDNKVSNMQIYELKGSFNNNRYLYKTNNNYNNFNDNKKFKNHNIEKGYMTFKNTKYSPFPHNFVNNNKRKYKNINLYNQRSEDIFQNYKIVKILKDNLIFEPIDDRFDNIVYETNTNNSNKFNLSRKLQMYDEKKSINFSSLKSIKNPIKIENTKTNSIYSEEKKNISKKKLHLENNKNSVSKIEIKKEPKKEVLSLTALLEKYFEDIKNITDKDFHIFKFKDKVGHKNVLPLMGYAILRTLGLIDSKIISIRKLQSFLITVSDNYKITTLYHNSLHGADVTQSLCVYFLNSNAEEICESTVLDLLGMIISALGHDLGHPGLNNNFHINDSTDLAITYNDASCLENFHTSYLFKILRKEENNIIEKFSVQNYKTIRKRMISQILATDMANHGETISLIRTKIKSWKEEGESRFNLLTGNEKTKFDEQQILLNYLIHMADLGHNCKKYEISIIWIKLLCEEFWMQGDKEKAKGLPISFMCDRNKIDVPASQVGFLRGFILSSFDCLAEMFPKLKYNIENAENNIKQWKKLQDEKRLLGWTPKKEKKGKKDEKEENKAKGGV